MLIDQNAYYICHSGMRHQKHLCRLVLTHGSYCEELLPILRVLQDNTTDIRRIVPGRISRTKSHAPHFRLHVSLEVNGGFKAVARKGSTAQDVFFSTSLPKEDLVNSIDLVLESKYKRLVNRNGGSHSSKRGSAATKANRRRRGGNAHRNMIKRVIDAEPLGVDFHPLIVPEDGTRLGDRTSGMDSLDKYKR